MNGGAGRDREVAVAVEEAGAGKVANGADDRVVLDEIGGIGSELEGELGEGELGRVLVEQQGENGELDRRVPPLGVCVGARSEHR